MLDFFFFPADFVRFYTFKVGDIASCAFFFFVCYSLLQLVLVLLLVFDDAQ